MKYSDFKRIYVEDELPAFLRARQPGEGSMKGAYHTVSYAEDLPPEPPYYLLNSELPRSRPLRTQQESQLPAIHPDFPHSEAPHHRIDTPTQPLLDGWFLARVAAILIALNSMLYLLHELSGPSPAERLTMQPHAQHITQPASRLEQRVGTMVTPRRP